MIGVISYSIAAVAYLALALLLISVWRGRAKAVLLLAAVVASLAWAATAILLAAGWAIPPLAARIAELARGAGWLFFLCSVLAADSTWRARGYWTFGTWGVVLMGGCVILLLPGIASWLGLDPGAVAGGLLIVWVVQGIFGLLLVEQLIRNRDSSQRWGIKHLCLGLGAVFAYDLFFYSDGLLMHRLDSQLWEARGIVNALTVPLLAVSVARNPNWSLPLHVSRQAVFYSATLTGAGVYLLAMAGAGYYIRYFGGAWGAVLQIAFLFSALLFLLMVLFSAQIRSRLRVLLSLHFFSFKYDYRAEWLRFTDSLSREGVALPEALITALADIVASPGGLLWLRTEYQSLELVGRVSSAEPGMLVQREEHPFIQFLKRTGWVIDLDELQRRPDVYERLELPSWLSTLEGAWLIVPLMFRAELCGFVVLQRSREPRVINWEDRALLKTAGRQAASHAAQYLSDQALIRARQFEAFNQLSAYVAHDLKNLLAQQSLMLSNAEHHKDNPEFLEDVITTIKSSVERMSRLMAQLRRGARGEQRQKVDLGQLLSDAVACCASRKPVPRMESGMQRLDVVADEDRLRTVLEHIIQNAQEAAPPDGRVVARLLKDRDRGVVEIEDDGIGMSDDFIRDRLFRPFDTTKGLAGMGVGAFESREYLRLLGGDVTVISQPGAGSLFRLSIPCEPLAPAVSGDARPKEMVA